MAFEMNADPVPQLIGVTVATPDGDATQWTTEEDGVVDAGPNELGILIIQGKDELILAAYSPLGWKAVEYHYASA